MITTGMTGNLNRFFCPMSGTSWYNACSSYIVIWMQRSRICISHSSFGVLQNIPFLRSQLFVFLLVLGALFPSWKKNYFDFILELCLFTFDFPNQWKTLICSKCQIRPYCIYEMELTIFHFRFPFKQDNNNCYIFRIANNLRKHL